MTETAPAETGDRMPRIGLGAIVTYAVLAMGLAWLFVLPLWLGDGLATPGAILFITAMMYTPAIAVLIVMLVLRPVPRGQRLRFLGIWPLRPAKRVIWMCVIALFGTVAVVILGIVIAALCGWLSIDLTFAGYAQLLRDSVPAGTELPPVGLLIAIQLVSIPFAAATVNALAAFGEEVGWRGFLVPALRRWGTWPSLLISGVIWGVWHAPIILLGYNFGRTDITGVLLMVGGCMAWGVLFGWTRLRTGSMWPAAFAHGALNASAGLVTLVAAVGAAPDPALAFALGASGWIACAIVIVILLLTGQFRTQPALAAPRPAASDPLSPRI